MHRLLPGGRRALPAALALGLLLALLAGVNPARAEGTAVPAAGDTTPGVVAIVLHPLHGAGVLYTGRRTERHQGGHVIVDTDYLSPGGQAIQRTEGVYDEATLAPVSWRMDDLRSGEAERIERDGAQVRLSYRLTRKDALKSTTLAFKLDQVFTPTVVPLIQRDWAKLLAGQTVSFRLLVPSRLDSYGFRIQRDRTPALQRPGRVVLRMEPDSWFVRRLVDPLYFVLDAQAPHALVEFRGRSSIRTDGGDTQDLRMDFRPEAAH